MPFFSSFKSSSKSSNGKPLEDVMAHVNISGKSTSQQTSAGQKLWANKRVAVAAEGSVASHVNVVAKPERTKVLIGNAIKDNLLFQELPQAALQIIIDSMTMVTVPANTDIIRQGDQPASEFYVLEVGSADVWVQPSPSAQPDKVLTYGPGSAFGELALLYSSPRAATVRSTSPCQLWVMQRSVYHAVKRNFTHEAFAARHKLLDSVPCLKNLTAQQRALLVDALQQADFKSGTTVFKKGDPGKEFYIIREGTALVKDGSNGSLLTRLGPGQHFGERALMGGDFHAADVVAETRLVVYKLSSEHFAELLGSVEEIWRFEALQKVPLLYNLTEQQLWQLAKAMGTATYTAGQMVFLKGDIGDTFYVVQEGSFSCFETHGGVELARVVGGGCFGELALLRREPRAACVMAVTDSKVLTLSRDQFTALLGNLSQLRSVWRLEALRKVPLLATLPPAALDRLADKLEQVYLKSNTEVIKQGEVGDRFYIVEHGRLGVFKQGQAGNGEQGALLVYGPGGYFGELALLRKEPRAATVRSLTDCSLLALSRADFTTLLGSEPGLEAKMAKEAEVYLTAAWKGGKKEIEMNEVHALAVLGAGGFGQVLLTRYRGDYHALKCVAKAFVIEQGLVQHIKREKDHMQECCSPFLVNMIGSSQDDQTLYMMIEAVMGGELFSYLQSRSRPLSEDHARFYAASVITAMQYLHDKELVYRDLKPENLLIDTQGYVKVTDFGFVKRVKRGTKTYTLCGTPEYLAPEIIMNKGHNQAADWWAVGVLLYELVAGAPPFMDDNRLAMFKKACARQITWPKHFSQPLRSLIDRLLDPNPLFRLGSGRAGAGEIKCHPWYAGFDWQSFYARKMPAPYIPKQPSHPGDPVNFKNQTPLNHVFRCKHTLPRTPFEDF